MEKDIGKEIEEVAFSLFQEFGVENVSMHKIAKQLVLVKGPFTAAMQIKVICVSLFLVRDLNS